MTFDLAKLYGLLPSYVRVRDAEQGEPLKALLSIVAEQVAVLEDDLEQLYDDQFIETCAEWAVPYIGDLVGARGLFVFKGAQFSQRALVADTLSDRRRKGTAASLERLAWSATQWNATVVEFFERLATTQYMNHVRRDNLIMPNLRRWEQLEPIGTPFDRTARLFEARRIATNRGRYNIPNIGIFLWRLGAYSVTFAPPAPAGVRRYVFDALGKPMPLYARPEDNPLGVPQPITRRVLDADVSRYYGVGRSLAIRVNDADIPASQVRCCNLSDAEAGEWAQKPGADYVIDPVLGRLLVPKTLAPTAQVRVTYQYGFSAAIGGGEYAREATFATDLEPIVEVKTPAKIQNALNGLTAGGVTEVMDNEIYAEALAIHAPAGKVIEVRADDGTRPIVRLTGDAVITGGSESSVTLNGLVIAGGALRVPAANNQLRVLRLRHCTLMPGTASALIVELPDCTVEIDSCITGGIRSVDGSHVAIVNSILDAGAEDRVAYAGLMGHEAGATLRIAKTTVIGKVRTLLIDEASNCIFLSRFSELDFWEAPVSAERLQEGCVRFSYVPPGSRVPRRYQCQPVKDSADAFVRPVLTSRRHGDPGYGQLDTRCPAVIRHGADDGAEMGAFHDLFQPQRVANLRARLDEYLRFGLEAGIFVAS